MHVFNIQKREKKNILKPFSFVVFSLKIGWQRARGISSRSREESVATVTNEPFRFICLDCVISGSFFPLSFSCAWGWGWVVGAFLDYVIWNLIPHFRTRRENAVRFHFPTPLPTALGHWLCWGLRDKIMITPIPISVYSSAFLEYFSSFWQPSSIEISASTPSIPIPIRSSNALGSNNPSGDYCRELSAVPERREAALCAGQSGKWLWSWPGFAVISASSAHPISRFWGPGTPSLPPTSECEEHRVWRQTDLCLSPEPTLGWPSFDIFEPVSGMD